MVKHFLFLSLPHFLCVSASLRSSLLLAQIDVLNLLMLVVGTFNTVASLVLGYFIYRMQDSVNRFDRAEDKSDGKIKALSESLHQMATKLIDERFRAISHEVQNSAQSLVASIDEVKGRLKDGEGEFGALTQNDHQIEQKMSARFESLKDWMRENTASKGDLKDHERTVSGKFEKLDNKVGQLTAEVAVLADRTKR